MKKIFVMFLVFCISVFSMSCSGNENLNEKSDFSSDNSSDIISAVPEDQSSVIENNIETDHGCDMRILYFDSFQEMAELKEMLKATEEEMKEYLSEHGYYYFNSKQEVEAFFNKMGDCNIAYLDESYGYSVASISYYENYDYIGLSYSNIRIINYFKDEEENEPATKSEKDIYETVAIAGQDVDFYFAEGTDNLLIGEIYTENSHIFVRLRYKTINKAITDNIKIDTLNNIIGQQ